MKRSLRRKSTKASERKSRADEVGLFLLLATVLTVFFAMLSSMYLRPAAAAAAAASNAARKVDFFVSQSETRLNNEDTLRMLNSMTQPKNLKN